MSLLLLLAAALCAIFGSQSMEIKKETNLTRPEVRSLQNAVIQIMEKSVNKKDSKSKGFGKKLYQDFFREMLFDKYKMNLCGKESENTYYRIRTALAKQFLSAFPRTYQQVSVASSSKKKQPLLYMPLLDTSFSSFSDVQFKENPLPSTLNIEDHNLRLVDDCFNTDFPSALNVKFKEIFENLVLPMLPEKLSEVFQLVLREREKFKEMYNIMKSLAQIKIQDPPNKNDIRSNVEKAMEDIKALKELGQVNGK